MALKVLATPWDAFWVDIENRVRAHDSFVDMSGDMWVFWDKNDRVSKVFVDFSILDAPHVCHENIASLTLNSQTYPLTAKEYTKLCCSEWFSTRSTGRFGAFVGVLAHLFAFLRQKNESHLNTDNAEAFYASFLSMTITPNGFINRISSPSYFGSLGFVSFPQLRTRLKMVGVGGVLDASLTTPKLNKALDKTCQAVMGISFNDYKAGESYDYLGLELGQYYVDFLKNRYESEYLNTLVCIKTLRHIRQMHNFESLSVNDRKYLTAVLLSGLSNVKDWMADRGACKGINFESLFNEVKDVAFSQYEEHFEKTTSLNQSVIEETVGALGLDDRFDGVEVVRTLLLQKYWGLSGHKTPREVWQGYLASLSQAEMESGALQNLNADNVYRIVDEIISVHRLSRAAFLSQFHAWVERLLQDAFTRTMNSFEPQLNLTAQAMATLVVSYLGYRKSEFGFPLDAIHTEPNIDILDSAYVPFRFKLKWYVPKTNGSAKINREITSQCYQLVAQLHDLYGKHSGEACLYLDNRSKSELFIANLVAKNWKSFVCDYTPFNEGLQLKALLEYGEETLSNHSRATIKELSQKYPPNSAKFKNLVEQATSVRKDLSRVLISRNIGGMTAHNAFKASLQSYIDSGLVENAEHDNLINTYLSDETKALLRNGTFILNQRSSADIRKEIQQGVRYPTPHAFRHIWAEAVLTRYQGDVGTVIRHQFCHLDNSFFMAYLRNKEASDLMSTARQRYLNSIVETLILESKSDDYQGGFFRYVNKAVEMTKPVDDNERLLLQERIHNRIISIQPSRFAICLPREGAESRAKCAQFGSINPQDAKPEFCLNCTNALITTGHIKGIVQTIQPMMKEAMHPHVMGFMVQEHLPTLYSARKRISRLSKSVVNKAKLDKILDSITLAINSIETKLKEEEVLYA
ncbi:hypothetical protein BS015_RS15990 [Vibrio parahaemolyticus]|nr:hypothetical protein [Vibrio parahaemolyticus]EGQ9476652.1 hypothetical protein [Vibrio parahaemolyticus]EJG0185014.1 hypothetical protein [Vibrio parahaemolyticus]EJG0190193.1 hypothetical protein [Vibrio parahaemolyticus]EJG2048184.1 hypothetical protein [Vibrio parahaemolyticus]